MDGPVEGLVFDLDGTLCEYRRSGAAILDAAFEATDVEPFFDVYDYYSRLDTYVEQSTTIREIRTKCFADLAVDAGHDPAVGTTVADAYATERDHRNVEWLPGAKAALDTLGERYPLSMVTNGDEWMQSQKLEALGIADRFETVIHAGFDAPSKPAAEPFSIALDAMDVRPPRAATIGDTLRHDVAGAHNAGLLSVWVDRDGTTSPEPEPHYRIESMHELLDEPWQ